MKKPTLRNKTPIKIICFSALLFFLLPQEALAQYSGRSGGYSAGPGGFRRPGTFNTPFGPYIGLGLNIGTGIGGDLINEVGPGIGLEGTLGFRVNPVFALETSLRNSIHIGQGTLVDFFMLDAGAKFYVPTARRTDIFLRIGGGIYALSDANANRAFAVGLGASLGLGYDLHIGDRTFVGLEGRAHLVQFFDQNGNNQSLAVGEIIPRLGFFF